MHLRPGKPPILRPLALKMREGEAACFSVVLGEGRPVATLQKGCQAPCRQDIKLVQSTRQRNVEKSTLVSRPIFLGARIGQDGSLELETFGQCHR